MRQSEVRHVAEPLGKRIYGFPSQDPVQRAESLASQRHLKAEAAPAQPEPKKPQGLETDSSWWHL